MGRILKKRPESAPSNWQAVLTEMEINDAWSLKLEDNTADNARAAIKRLRRSVRYSHLRFKTHKHRKPKLFIITRINDDPGLQNNKATT